MRRDYIHVGTLVILVIGMLMGGCTREQTRLEYAQIESPSMGRSMDYGVYLPPGWDRQDPLPLVVFLHGGGDDERSFEEHGAAEVLDSWINAGKLSPVALVTPRGEMGFWANWYDGSRRYKDYVLDDVISEVRRRYQLRGGRENTHLMGISMGGSGGLFMALEHRDRFASAALISAPIYTDDQVMEMLDGFLWRVFFRARRVLGPAEPEHVASKSLYGRVRGPDAYGGMKLLFGAGDGESEMIRETNQDYHRYLKSKGVSHRYVTYRGEHSWHDWKRLFPAALCLHVDGELCQLEPSDFFTIRSL